MNTFSPLFSHHRLAGIALLASLVLAAPLSVVAEDKVYKSVDAEGNIIYSDNPVEDAVSVEQIPLRSVNDVPEVTADQRIEQMAATTARLREDRQAREEARREARAARTPPAGEVYQPVPATRGQAYIVPRHFPNRHHGVKPPYRHGHKHKGREHRRQEHHGATVQPTRDLRILPPGVERNPPRTGHRLHRGGQREESPRARFDIK